MKHLKSFFILVLATSFLFLHSGCKKDPYPGYDAEIDLTGAWTSVGTFTGNINDMAVSGGKLWFGGSFTKTPSGYTTRGSAYYDGTNFYQVNHTYLYSNMQFNKFMVSGDTIYAVGNLSSSKGNFLYWNSTAWQTKYSSSQEITAFAEYNNRFFVVYEYPFYPYHYIAGYAPSNSWSADGMGNDFEVYNNELYITGYFYDIAGNSVYYVSKYNGVNWTGVGVNYSSNNPGNDLIVYNNELYICGSFSSMGGSNQTNGIAKWNGTTWSSVGGGFTTGGTINKMTVSNGSLYVCGSFSEIGGVKVANVARWDGTSWSSPGKILSGTTPVSSIVEYNGYLYASAGGAVYKYEL